MTENFLDMWEPFPHKWTWQCPKLKVSWQNPFMIFFPCPSDVSKPNTLIILCPIYIYCLRGSELGLLKDPFLVSKYHNNSSHLVLSGVWFLCLNQSCSRQYSCKWSGSQPGRCYWWLRWRWHLHLCWLFPLCIALKCLIPGHSPSKTRPVCQTKQGYSAS